MPISFFRHTLFSVPPAYSPLGPHKSHDVHSLNVFRICVESSHLTSFPERKGAFPAYSPLGPLKSRDTHSSLGDDLTAASLIMIRHICRKASQFVGKSAFNAAKSDKLSFCLTQTGKPAYAFLGPPKTPNCQRAGKGIFPFPTSDNY